MNRTPLVNLKHYRVTLTTSYEVSHGVSGHLFEMIEYFMHFRFYKNINACILVSDSTSEDEFFTALDDKYDLTAQELADFKAHTFFKPQPKVILANTLLITDGSLRTFGADLLANKILMFRCADEDIVRENVTVLQDDEVYSPLPNSIHYKKKILFDKFKQRDTSGSSSAAMFYLTSNSRSLSDPQVQDIISRHKFDSYIAISNNSLRLTNVEVKLAPVKDLWLQFGTYIYTNTAKRFDCSPRFIVECNYYGKDVIYEIDYHDLGLEVRKQDLIKGILALTADDEISIRI